MRFRLRTILVTIAVLCTVFAGYAWFHRRFLEPQRQADAVVRHVRSLSERRPKEIPPQQWNNALGWTINLHYNSLLPFQADSATIARFKHRLSEKLNSDVSTRPSIGSG
jgi:hypothetical protein